MLAVMMIGGRKYANTVNLLTATPWTVPSGVTTIYINAATAGAGPYFTDSALGSYVGGGGGGAYIIDGKLTVASGDVLKITTINESASSGTLYTCYKNNTTFLFSISAGQRGQVGGTGSGAYGGYGGGVVFGAQTIDGGAPGNGATAGGDGQTATLTNGGTVITGGGGGGGGTVTPQTAGSDGGDVGAYLGSYGLSNGFGGGGGGFFPGNGQVTLSPNPTYVYANTGTSYIYVNY